LQPELWALTPGLERYEVSTEGNVRHIEHRKILRLCLHRHGYVAFYYRILGAGRNGRRQKLYVHRAVALTFVVNPHPKKWNTVDHINRDRADNRVENLRWANRKAQSKNRNGDEGYSDEEWTKALEDGLV